MNKNVWMLTGACALAVGIAGCSPQLDQTRLSPEEQAWADSIKANYSAWQPPESIPRAVRRDDINNDNQAVQSAAQAGSELKIETAEVAPVETMATVENNVPVETVQAAPAPAVEAVPAPVAEQAPEVYTVVKGDNLGAIAQKYYGRASAWKKIQQANMSVLRGKNKDLIRPGMKLTIPRP